VTALAGCDLLQIGAGAEIAAAAGQDPDRQRRISIEAAKRGGKRLSGRTIDGVARPGPFDRDDRDRSIRLQ
jgi:hypothetical protein